MRVTNLPLALALTLTLTPTPNPSPNPNVKVHVGVAAAMTGVSRFLQRPSPWSYSKDESLASPEDFQRFTYLLAAAEDAPVAGFESFLVAHGFSRVQLWPPALLTEPKVRVLKRKVVREDARAKPSGDYMF